MPELDGKYFRGEDQIPPDTLRKLYVSSPARIQPEEATRLGWDGKLSAGVILQLAEDGVTVRRGSFTLLGELASEPIVIPASKIWEKVAKDLHLTITIPTADNFSFMDGGLCSDYMDGDEFSYTISKGTTPVLPTHYRRHGIIGLSLRLLAHMSKGSNGRGGPLVKITILAFPLDVDELREECEATQSAAWAGIKVLEAECPLFPAAPPNSWGNPFFPLVYRANQELACTASREELRSAIAAIMGAAYAPTACTNTTALKKFWDMMRADVEKSAPRAPHITWPKINRPDPAEGKKGVINQISQCSGSELNNFGSGYGAPN